MAEISKKNILSIYNNTKIAIEQIKINNLLNEESKRIFEEYYKDYPYGNAYLCMLHKIGIINSKGEVISTLNTQDTEPRSFCFLLKNADFKFLSTYDDNELFLYNLVITPRGEIMFEAFQDIRKIYFETFESNSYKIFLDLPYILAKIIKDENLVKVRKSMEKFVENNISCTLSNLFNFTKKNIDIVDNIPLYFSNLENDIRENSNARGDISDGFRKIPNSFALKYKNPRKSNYYGEKRVTVRYYIEKNEKSEYFFSLDISKIDYGRSEWLSSFPVKIMINENSIIPRYLPYDYFINKNTSLVFNEEIPSIKDDSLLISYDSKLDDYEVFRLSLEEGQRKKYPDKIGFLKEIDKNLKSVIWHFNKYVKTTNAININIDSQKKIDIVKDTTANLKNSSTVLSSLLVQLYKKEIVFNNI